MYTFNQSNWSDLCPFPTQLANCLYHETVRAAISDQIDEVVQSTVNSYLLRSDPSIMETNSALALNVSYIPEVCVCACVCVCVCVCVYTTFCTVFK